MTLLWKRIAARAGPGMNFVASSVSHAATGSDVLAWVNVGTVELLLSKMKFCSSTEAIATSSARTRAVLEVRGEGAGGRDGTSAVQPEGTGCPLKVPVSKAPGAEGRV